MAIADSTVRLDVAKEIAAMERMTAGKLQEKYAEVFGEETRSRHKRYLIRRIAWRMQANAEGGLSERARLRADELANDAEIRVTPPREKAAQHPDSRPASSRMDARRDSRLPRPGNWIEREYKGRTIRVLVVPDGFEYEGERFRSLSAIAKSVTGSHINGFLFFRLRGDQ